MTPKIHPGCQALVTSALNAGLKGNGSAAFFVMKHYQATEFQESLKQGGWGGTTALWAQGSYFLAHTVLLVRKHWGIIALPACKLLELTLI